MRLIRYPGNPVLKPAYIWEEGGVFNAGAVYHNGLFHLLYRAVYGENRSNIGYAVSRDGFHFFRLDKPVFEHKGDHETFGAEDPRITKIGDTFYMLYTAYSEIGVRVSLASTKNFIAWTRYGVVLPDVDDKDAVLFPEKINNKYVMLHRIHPDIWIAYSDDLIHWNGHRVIMTPRKGYWDSEKIGAGAPPIKTEKGWLIFYHGVDGDNVYRLGVALLDLEDPSIVLKRQEEPVLEPEKYYELEGIVPNVVFTCGAVEVNDTYYVYYGGGDYVIGVATVKKEEVRDFIEE
ncbi:MAG TPA: glycosidase [bacterium]|nr:glycosidase [bacterium]